MDVPVICRANLERKSTVDRGVTNAKILVALSDLDHPSPPILPTSLPNCSSAAGSSKESFREARYKKQKDVSLHSLWDEHEEINVMPSASHGPSDDKNKALGMTVILTMTLAWPFLWSPDKARRFLKSLRESLSKTPALQQVMKPLSH